MMIHEKLISGQFVLDLQNDQPNMLNNHHHMHHNNQQHPGLTAHYLNHRHQSLPFQQPKSPPMSTIKMDIYAAYAYQQQKQLINTSEKDSYSKTGVLDLSRRCDSVETPRKTPSPGQTNSSIGTASPAASPTNLANQQTVQQSIIPSNLLFSVNQHDLPHSSENLNSVHPTGLASFYPALYYSSGIIKPEPLPTSSPSSTPPPSNQIVPTALESISNSSQLNSTTSASDLLQTFANAASATARTTQTAAISHKNGVPETKAYNSYAPAVVPTSPDLKPLASIDAKTTRPFKAFPRDPLVIAANFAATDVLLDNPRVERYTEYRKRVLQQIRCSNGGTPTITNPKMRRTNLRNPDFSGSSACRSSSEERHEEDNKIDSKINVTSVEESSDCDSNAGSFSERSITTLLEAQSSKCNSSGVVKDAAYYERRRKNNAAAKKSRDRRRIKEDEIAIRAAYLERQNIELLCQIDALKAQIAAFTSKVGA